MKGCWSTIYSHYSREESSSKVEIVLMEAVSPVRRVRVRDMTHQQLHVGDSDGGSYRPGRHESPTSDNGAHAMLSVMVVLFKDAPLGEQASHTPATPGELAGSSGLLALSRQ